MASMPGDAHPERWRTLHEFAEVDRAFRDVRRHVARAPECIAATAASAKVAGLDLDRDIRMVVGELQVSPHTARIPIHWEDRHHPALFPILEATLEFAPATGRRPITRIAFLGRYRPPLGALGSLGDSLAGGRVVLESVVAFLSDLVARLEEAIPRVDS
jgi:hypothetical protein